MNLDGVALAGGGDIFLNVWQGAYGITAYCAGTGAWATSHAHQIAFPGGYSGVGYTASIPMRITCN